MEMYKEIDFVFILANTISILHPMEPGEIFAFKFLDLRNRFPKSIVAIDSNLSDWSEQTKLKTFCNSFAIIDAIERTFMKPGWGQDNNVNKSLEEVDLILHEWLREVWDFTRRNNCKCGGKRTRIRIGAWRCDWITAISWSDLNRWGVASYEWAKKLIS